MKQNIVENLLEIPEYYGVIRLLIELESNSITEIRHDLEFEITLYKQVPQMLQKNYSNVDFFLEYILAVKNYDEKLYESENLNDRTINKA